MVGILIVSHSEEAARGIARIASAMSQAGDAVPIVGIGGDDAGGLGISFAKILDAMREMLLHSDALLILPDIGSSVLASRSAISMLSPAEAARVKIADAPVLEGAVVAAVEAGGGADLEEVARAAGSAYGMNKGEQ